MLDKYHIALIFFIAENFFHKNNINFDGLGSFENEMKP